jgi:hypothetical protein
MDLLSLAVNISIAIIPMAQVRIWVEGLAGAGPMPAC